MDHQQQQHQLPKPLHDVQRRGAIDSRMLAEDREQDLPPNSINAMPASPSSSWVTVLDSDNSTSGSSEPSSEPSPRLTAPIASLRGSPKAPEATQGFPTSIDRTYATPTTDDEDVHCQNLTQRQPLKRHLSAAFEDICSNTTESGRQENALGTRSVKMPRSSIEAIMPQPSPRATSNKAVGRIPRTFTFPSYSSSIDTDKVEEEMEMLRATNLQLIESLRDSTSLVQRLHTRERIALSERNQARAEMQRIREECEAMLQVGKKGKGSRGWAWWKGLIVFAVFVALLGGVQWVNWKLYQPEFEWVEKVTREVLGLK